MFNPILSIDDINIENIQQIINSIKNENYINYIFCNNCISFRFTKWFPMKENFVSLTILLDLKKSDEFILELYNGYKGNESNLKIFESDEYLNIKIDNNSLYELRKALKDSFIPLINKEIINDEQLKEACEKFTFILPTFEEYYNKKPIKLYLQYEFIDD